MAIVVAVIVIAAIAVFLVVYLGSGSITVTSTSQFVSAGNQTAFQASVSPPPLVNVGTINWNFGDNTTASGAQGSASHTYGSPGNYLVYASASLSNGNSANNALKLFPVVVGVPEAIPGSFGTTKAYGAINFNVSKSSPGAPVIAAGGHIDFVVAPTHTPTFEMDTNPTTGTWVNFTWRITSLTVRFGDGQSASNTSADKYEVDHTYSTAGIFLASLAVTTANGSVTQVNGVSSGPWAPSTQTLTTTVGLTVAVGSYGIVTYQGSVIKPGIITNMEAVTGGYTTLDPALDYESTGFEIIANVYETLLEYNGTSTSTFVPVVADSIPTVANGGVSADFMNYTFHIRPNLKFSNGDAVTPWDVKYSVTRTMLMNSGSPFPPGWIISQFLVNTTFVSSLNAADTFAQVNGSISVNNASNTVTFHLYAPAPPLLFYQVVADPLGAAIVDHLWLESTGPHITWSPAGFMAYEQYSNLANYVSAWRNGAVGSGPYMIDYVSNPDTVVLKPNPTFTPLPGVPASTVSKVVLMYVGDDSTRELSIESGQADIAGIVASHFDVAKRLQGEGLAKVLFTPTLNMFWWNFNLEIANSAVGSTSNPYGNQVPSNFFVDINMRKAFFYAFNFQQYLGQILGNQKFNATFGIGFNGIVPKGMIGYQDLTSLNTYNMVLARKYYNATKWVQNHGGPANAGFTLAINVETADTVNRASAAMWAQSLTQLGAGINILVKPISFEEMITDSVPHQNPMGIYYLGWLPDYPFPTDYTLPMLLPADVPVTSTYDGGTYPNANGYNIQYLQADPNGSLPSADANATNQITVSQNIRNWIIDSISPPNATNVNQVIIDSDKAQMAAANITLYVPAFQQFTFFTYRTWITGMENELNPVLGGTDLLYDFITKPSTTTTSSLSTSSMSTINAVLLVALSSPMMTIALVGLGDDIRKGRKKE